MSKIIDKEALNQQVINALQRCVEKKPLANVSLRDIEKEAGISHQNLLYYYGNKERIFQLYIDHISTMYALYYRSWLEYDPASDGSLLDYIGMQLSKLLQGDSAVHSHTFSQIATLAQYNGKIRETLKSCYENMHQALADMLEKLYGAGQENTASALLSFVEGLQFYDMNYGVNPADALHMLNSLKYIQ